MDMKILQLIFLLQDAPKSYLSMMKNILTNNENGTDWTRGVVKPVFRDTWILFLAVYIVIAVLGAVLSVYMCVDIIHRKWFKTNTGKYLLNLAVGNTIIAVVEVPMNFLAMIFENWILGGAFCYTAAVVPYLLVHSCMMTFIMLIADRYRYIAHPEKRQINSVVALVVVWVLSICISSPILAYIHYRDVGHLNPKLRNNGLCWSTGDNYSKVVFSCAFTLPFLVVILLLSKISSELKTQKALNHLHYTQSEKHNNVNNTKNEDINSMIGEDSKEQFKDTCWVQRQRCTQKYLTLIILLWSVCWLPLKLFSVINVNSIETEDNIDAIDIAHMIFLPITAVCAITTPICYKLMVQKFVREKYGAENKSDPRSSYALVSADSSAADSNNSSKASDCSFVGAFDDLYYT